MQDDPNSIIWLSIFKHRFNRQILETMRSTRIDSISPDGFNSFKSLFLISASSDAHSPSINISLLKMYCLVVLSTGFIVSAVVLLSLLSDLGIFDCTGGSTIVLIILSTFSLLLVSLFLLRKISSFNIVAIIPPFLFRKYSQGNCYIYSEPFVFVTLSSAKCLILLRVNSAKSLVAPFCTIISHN